MWTDFPNSFCDTLLHVSESYKTVRCTFQFVDFLLQFGDVALVLGCAILSLSQTNKFITNDSRNAYCWTQLMLYYVAQ